MSLSLSQNDLICQHLTAFCSSTPGSRDFVDALGGLDKISADLARNASTRESIGRSSPGIWEKLRETWQTLSTRSISLLVDDSMQREWTLCVARFTRNLVAENPSNQRDAFQFEPSIRAVAHAYTSHVFAVNEEEFMTTRFLMQTISNIVTSDESLVQKLWSTYMALAEEKNILIRMMAHTDDRTVVATLVFITNCLVGNRERMRMLTDTTMGRRLCVTMLDKLARYVETSDDDDHSDIFNLGWAIFKRLFENGFAPSLLSITTMEGEIINPHQTTLLKLLDSYLMQSSAPNVPEEKNTYVQSQDCVILSQITTTLSIKFFELVRNAQSSIRHSLGQSDTAGTAPDDSAKSNPPRTNAAGANMGQDVPAPLQSLDVLLPKVCEATVLVAQCFCTISLAQDACGNLSEEARWTRQFLTDCTSPNGAGVIENLIELLRLLDAFLPRIMFGKASWSTPRPNGTPPPTQPDKKEDRGFSYLKRDLVRLLGILCYENRAMQDRVRVCDGITVVMNLCITDERNPYLREHALFALRNLLHDNVENQAVVDAIKPMGTWDENGVLRDAPGVRK